MMSAQNNINKASVKDEWDGMLINHKENNRKHNQICIHEYSYSLILHTTNVQDYYNKRTGAGKKIYTFVFIIAHVNHELLILKHKINPKLVFLSG